MNATDRAYIAGLLDGEGCIGVDKIKSRHSARELDFKLRIIITNCNSDVLFWLKQTVGSGCVYQYKKSGNKNWRPVHRWQVVSEQARAFLLEVYPYLRIKKEIAEIVLQLPKLPPSAKGLGRSDRHYSQQSAVYHLAKNKNRRGVQLN